MPADLIKRVNLDALYPPFMRKLLDVLATAREMGQDYYAISGFRSPEEQDAIYAQGRTKSGPKVTNARGGFSAHNWGIAVDVAADVSSKPGLQPSWDVKKYAILKKAGKQHGLQVGVPGLGDDGHIQLPLTTKLGKRERALFTELTKIYASGGMQAVWKQLDVWGFSS